VFESPERAARIPRSSRGFHIARARYEFRARRPLGAIRQMDLVSDHPGFESFRACRGSFLSTIPGHEVRSNGELSVATGHIRESIDRAVTFLTEQPEKARYVDRPATATVEGLRAEVTGQYGESLVSDMPRSVGGGGSAPTPGWFLRAAVAGCDATVIAMRAAAEGIELSTLEVTVTSESDDRGFLGMDDSLPAGPLQARTHVRIGADGVSPDTLRDIVEWAEMHSPVSDALRRAVPTTVNIEIA